MTFPMNTPNVGMTQQQQVATEAAVTQLAAGVLTNEERIIRLEVHAGHVAPALASVETQVHGLTNTVQNLSDTMTKMEEVLVNMLTQVTGTQSNLDAFKNQMTTSLITAEGTLTASLNNLAQKVNQNEAMIRQVEFMA